MWFCLFSLLLLLGVAYFQSIQGLFSGLIFCVCAVVSTGLAFGLYEYVGYELLGPLKPDIALPAALVACFGVPLVVLRLALDSAIRRAGLLPTLADKIGGACFGLVASLLCIGVMTTAIQMLPFGESFLSFGRFSLPAKGEDNKASADDIATLAARVRAGDDNHVWLSPDRFTSGFAAMLSDGLFRGERTFRKDHPDLLVEIGWSQALPAGPRRTALPGALSVEPPRIVDYVYTKSGGGAGQSPQYDPAPPAGGRAFWVYRLTAGPEAMDSDNEHRFALPQIRLVGDHDRYGPAQFIPTAVRDDYDLAKHVKAVQDGREVHDAVFELWRPGEDGVIEVAFEVPEGFTPRFLAYKQGAREVVAPPKPEDRLPPPTPAATAQPRPGASASTPPAAGASSSSGRPGGAPASTQAPPGGGRVTGVRTRAADSFFGDRFPITLTSFESPPGDQPAINGDVLREGSVVALADGQGSGGTGRSLARFYVPEEKRLLQLNVETIRAGSTLGRSLEFATRTLRNYILSDDSGQQYEMAGQYAIANVDGQEVIEVQYYPEQIGSIGRGIGDFSRIQQRHLAQPDTQLVFLYLMEQGRQAVQFSTGRRGQVDLSPYNLRAE